MPAASDVEVASQESSPNGEETKSIPHRMQQVLLNWILMVASVVLVLDVGALQRNIAEHSSYMAAVCHWFGVLSCLCWLLGFVLLTHWQHSVGATRMALAGCYLKILAACFFNLQPMTGTMNDPLFGGSEGLWWSNLTGILFFHAGNLVSCLDLFLHRPAGADKKKGWLYHGNLPILGMWVYQAATWFLVASNVLSCTFSGASWAPLAKTEEPPVYVCQFAGSFLLLLASMIYTAWCDGFRDFSHSDAGTPAQQNKV